MFFSLYTSNGIRRKFLGESVNGGESKKEEKKPVFEERKESKIQDIQDKIAEELRQTRRERIERGRTY